MMRPSNRSESTVTTLENLAAQAREFRFAIGGMTCASCVRHVEQALERVPGVLDASVNLATESAAVHTDGSADAAALIAAVADAGYDARVAQESSADVAAVADDTRETRHVVVAALLALPLVAPMLASLAGAHWMPPGWLQLALATPLQFWLGARFYRAAWTALRHRTANMDLLIALGTSAAYGLSLYNLAAVEPHAQHLYFETSAVLIALVLAGKWLERRARRKTGAAIRALQKLAPERARIVRDGVETSVALADVVPGDVAIVLPGERVPVDGEIVHGATQIDESLISGESLPLAKSPGDAVTGGSINGDGRIAVKTRAVGAESRLARIIRLVENAQSRKAPVQYLVDRISAVFVPIVVALALITLVAWGAAGDWRSGLINAIAVLVIACPCALGLATPTALIAGMGAAARSGILVRDADALERAEKLDVVAFDKTGTLTQGRPHVVAVRALDGDEATLVAQAASLSAGSTHPLAAATLAAAAERGLAVTVADEARNVPGHGVTGIVDGRRVWLGSARWLASLGVDANALDGAATDAGATLSWLAREDAGRPLPVGVIAFRDTPREGAREAVATLRAAGIDTVMISGDRSEAAHAIAASLGIARVLAEVTPEHKAEEVERLRAGGRTVGMVGDGVNDAPALAVADVGFAMAGGTDVAMEAAGVTLMRNDPRLVSAAIDVARRTTRKIRQNLFWAFVYNAVGLPLAALGWLNPVVAGLAMALSSLSVIGNAGLLARWRADDAA